MSQFSTKPVNMRDLGECLADCRKELGLTLLEAGKVSQVQPKYIQALEEGKFLDLPAEVYVKGFLRRLAAIYHLDEHDLIEQYRSERGIMQNLEFINRPPAQTGFIFSGFVLSRKAMTVAGIAALVAMSLVYLYFQVNSLHRPPRLRVTSPAEGGTVHSSLLVVTGETEPGAIVFLNNQEIVVDADGAFRENLTLGPGTNQLVIRSVNKFSKEAVITRPIVLAEKEIAGTTTVENLAPAGNPNLAELEISVGAQAAWIKVEADGRKEFEGTMLPGSAQKFQASNRITVSTGNAGTTRVKWNGKDLGVLGKEGEEMRDLEFIR